VKIFLITGKKRAGKDTLADVMLEQTKGVKESFASPMKDIASILFGWGMNFMENKKEVMDHTFGISPRQFLQVFGTDFMQFFLSEKFPTYETITGRSFWAKNLIGRIKTHEDSNWLTPESIVTVPDLRFPHEVDTLQKTFGDAVTVIRVVRPSLECQDNHPSEKEMDAIVADYTIENTGTLEEYQKACRSLCDILGLTTRKTIYIAGPITGKPNYNQVAFLYAKTKLQAKGYEVISPLEIVEPGQLPWESYMKKDIPILIDCDEVYMLKGWNKSKGAALEHSLALNLNIPITYEEEE
jgi:hypothetical protein